jgi:phage-related tail fiber protein
VRVTDARNGGAAGAPATAKGAVWELGQIAVRDAGIDDPRVDAFQTLVVQGVFVP